MAPTKGDAVSIYSDNKANPKALRDVLDQDDIRDLPIVVIPVAGEYRGGKSFLLSYFVRYLTKKNFGAHHDKLIGFDHKQSTTSVTEGINIWNKPLTMDKTGEDGKVQKILVLLMDSQGIFGDEDDDKKATRTFALSTMLSSIMMFNLVKQLNKAVLTYLKLFISFGKDLTAKDASEIPFQKLMILIRDWQNNKNYGSEGGDKYLKDFFGNQGNVFDNYFRDVSCYLMPHPGFRLINENANGCLGDLDKDFQQSMKELIEDLCHPDHLAKHVKNVASNPLTAGGFCDYFESCAGMIDKVDWEKQTFDVSEMKADINCDLAIKSALEVYTSQMDNKMSFILEEVTESSYQQLEKLNVTAQEEANSKYEEKARHTQMNEPLIFEKKMRALNTELDEKYAAYKKQHAQESKNEAELNCELAKKSALVVYTSNMDKEVKGILLLDTEEVTKLSNGQLEKLNETSQEEAKKIYEKNAIHTKMNEPQIFDKHMNKLDKDLNGKFDDYKEKLRRWRIHQAIRLFKKIRELLNGQIEKAKNNQLAVKISKASSAVVGVVGFGLLFSPLLPVAIAGMCIGAVAGATGVGTAIGDAVVTRNVVKEIEVQLELVKEALEGLKESMEVELSEDISNRDTDTAASAAFASVRATASGVRAATAGLRVAASTLRVVGVAFAGVGAAIGVADAIFSTVRNDPTTEEAQDLISKIDEILQKLEDLNERVIDETTN